MSTTSEKITTGFTLVELMVVILIVGILAAAVAPVLRGRLDSAKWSEGQAMMGTIATGIRAYHGEKGPTSPPPTTLGIGNTGLGFAAGDLTGRYFTDADFTFNVAIMDPLTFTVTANKAGLNPASYQLDQNGNWTP